MYLEQVGGVFIPISNLERSILFYTETLGLVCRGIEDWSDGKRGATLFFQPHPKHAALVTLVESKGSVPSQKEASFNFKCKDARQFHADLQAKGCRVNAIETWDSTWNHHVMFDLFDPDGHKINFIEMIPLAVAQRN